MRRRKRRRKKKSEATEDKYIYVPRHLKNVPVTQNVILIFVLEVHGFP